MKYIPSPHHSSRFGHRPRYVILHGTAGGSSAENVAAWFKNPDSRASTHYIDGRDGTVIRCVNEDMAAWANGFITAGADSWWSSSINPNLITISIEHVKPSSDNSDLLTPAQQSASFQLIKEICERHSIPKRPADGTGGITGHASIDPVNRSRCPGPYPWRALWAFLGQTGGKQGANEDMLSITDSFAARHFKDVGGDPQRWHCKTTKCDITGAILEYWRKTGGAFRLPRTNEIYDRLKDGASFQIFEAGVLVYDPKKVNDNPTGFGDVYAMHLDTKTPGLAELMKLAEID